MALNNACTTIEMRKPRAIRSIVSGFGLRWLNARSPSTASWAVVGCRSSISRVTSGTIVSSR
jgi:hypothetical protein